MALLVSRIRTPLRDLYLYVLGFLMPLRWALYVWL